MNNFYIPNRKTIIHSLIGGAISLFLMIVLVGYIQSGYQQLLINFKLIGIIAFPQYFRYAQASFVFGVGYLLGGFIGGFYTGYNAFENLNESLALTSMISCLGYTIIMTLFSTMTIQSTPLEALVLPLIGTVAGTYLGGYSYNWDEEKESEDDLFKVK